MFAPICRMPPPWSARRRRARVVAFAMASLWGGLVHAQAVDLATLLRAADPDALCAETQIIGQCTCGGVVCGVRVHRYVPVAFIETTVAPGDTLLGAAGLRPPSKIGTISSALSTTDNTAEAHVWRLPGRLAAMATGMPCLACSVASPAPPVAGAADEAAALCGPVGQVSQAVQASTGAVASVLPVPTLAYASELDWINWRTGCRDQFEMAMGAFAGTLACGLPGGAAAPAAPPSEAGATEATGAADPACIGAWGPLRPRQMRDIGPPPVLYSAKTAVRAMSIAREQLGTFPFPVDTEGKLEQVYPAVSACFGVGALPLPSRPQSSRPVATSANGRHGWIYWRPAACCVGLAGAAQCLRGMLPQR